MKNSVFYTIVSVLSITIGVFMFKIANINREPAAPVLHKENMNTAEASRGIFPENKPLRDTFIEKIPERKSVSEKEDRIIEYARRFNVPEKAKEKLLKAVREGRRVRPVRAHEYTVYGSVYGSLNEADAFLSENPRPSLSKEKKNLASGYSTDAENFDKMISACLPKGAYEDSDSAALKSRALSNMGLSALMEERYEDAEKAFVMLINNYPEQEAAQVIRLEYSMLLIRQERLSEAEQVVNEAIALNSDDKDYMSIAGSIKEKIDTYE